MTNFNLNFINIITYIQSDNVLFDCPNTNISEIANKIEEAVNEKEVPNKSYKFLSWNKVGNQLFDFYRRILEF